MYIEEETFNGINFCVERLTKGEYEECTFINCNFSNTDLSKITFINTKFVDCDLSNANITGTAFQDVTFNDCKLLGLQFDRCNDFGFAIRFNHCQLDHALFFQMKLNRTSFTDCKLIGVDFTAADLSKSKMTHCDLSAALFDRTILELADLSGSVKYSIDPENNNIKGARFSLPDVIGLLDKYKIKIEK